MDISLESYVPLRKDNSQKIEQEIEEKNLQIKMQYGGFEKNLWKVWFSYKKEDVKAQTFLLNKIWAGEIFQDPIANERHLILKGLA